MNWVFDAMGELRQYFPKLPKRRAKLTKPPKPTEENIAKEEARLVKEAQQAAQPPAQQTPPQVVPVPVQPIVQPVQQATQPAQPIMQPIQQPQPAQAPQQEQQVTAEQLLIEIYNKQITVEEKMSVLGELVKNMSELLRLMAQKKE